MAWVVWLVAFVHCTTCVRTKGPFKSGAAGGVACPSILGRGTPFTLTSPSLFPTGGMMWHRLPLLSALALAHALTPGRLPAPTVRHAHGGLGTTALPPLRPAPASAHRSGLRQRSVPAMTATAAAPRARS